MNIQTSSAPRRSPAIMSKHLEMDPRPLTLLKAYPCLCYKVGTIPANETTNATAQSWTSQEIPPPQASWKFHIIAVRNKAAQLHLNSNNLKWLQILPGTFLKHTDTIAALLTIPCLILQHAETAPGL